MPLKLYHHPISTCSQKVRLALAEKQLTVDDHVMDWDASEHLQDWYLALNPNGVVPTLVHDGRAIVDSSVICEYLDEAFNPALISPSTAPERAEMRAWMRYFEEVPTAAIRIPTYNAMFLRTVRTTPREVLEELNEKRPLRKHFYRQIGPEGFPQSVVEESIDKLKQCLRRIEGALSDGRPYLLKNGYSIADIVLTPSVVRLDDLDLLRQWGELRHLHRWYERIQERPSFNTAYMAGSRVDLAAWS